jgi:hypothetical protein
VLEDVGDTDPAVGLVEESRLYMGHDRHHRGGVIELDQECQAVGEHLASYAVGPDR